MKYYGTLYIASAQMFTAIGVAESCYRWHPARKMSAQLLELTDKLLSQTEEQWESQFELHDVNPARCRGALARARDIYKEHPANQYAYAYIGPTGNVDGIALMSHACPKSKSPWLKVLELTLAPAFVDVENPAPADDLIDIAGTVVTQVFGMTADRHRAESVKIYGDSVMDIRIWKSVAQKLQGNVTLPFDTSSHGRWLVLSRNGG